MGRCHIFNYKDPEQAGKKLDFEVIKVLPDYSKLDEDYVVLDRQVVRCKKCGEILLFYRFRMKTYATGEQNICTEFYPFEDVDSAVEANKKWPGDEISCEYPGKYLAQGCGVYSFGNDEECRKRIYKDGLRRCLCCGEFTLDTEYETICKVCFWEEDNLQHEIPNYEGGANAHSLNEAKMTFRKYGDYIDKHIKH